MTFRFVERSLEINRNSTSKLDGVVVMKVLIAMIENLKGRIDEAILYIIKICMNELLTEKMPKNYTSMVA
jgi:hypothetical protein